MSLGLWERGQGQGGGMRIDADCVREWLHVRSDEARLGLLRGMMAVVYMCDMYVVYLVVSPKQSRNKHETDTTQCACC